jgi:hypothetical protein
MKSRSACQRSARTCPRGVDIRPTAPREPPCRRSARTPPERNPKEEAKEKGEKSGTANDGDYFYSCASLLTSIPESVSALTAERHPPKAKSNPVWWAVEAKKQETCKRIAVDRARPLFLE